MNTHKFSAYQQQAHPVFSANHVMFLYFLNCPLAELPMLNPLHLLRWQDPSFLLDILKEIKEDYMSLWSTCYISLSSTSMQIMNSVEVERQKKSHYHSNFLHPNWPVHFHTTNYKQLSDTTFTSNPWLISGVMLKNELKEQFNITKECVT